MDTIVLAFDIETSGSNNKYDVIAIGASVLNDKYEELDSLFLPGYSLKETKFEPKCWNFWKENLEVLKTLIYDGDLSYQERQKDMIEKFQEFRLKWEKYCKENKCKLQLVSDNNVFDGGLLNDMITEYLPKHSPIPFTIRKGKYGSFYETSSMKHSLMMVTGTDTRKKYFELIDKCIKHPGRKYEHDHNPAHDAYGIAYDYMLYCDLGEYCRKLFQSSLT